MKENTVGGKQATLDGFFMASSGMHHVSRAGSCSTEVDIEDLLTLKKRKRQQTCTSNSKFRRKLKLVDVSKFLHCSDVGRVALRDVSANGAGAGQSLLVQSGMMVCTKDKAAKCSEMGSTKCKSRSDPGGKVSQCDVTHIKVAEDGGMLPDCSMVQTRSNITVVGDASDCHMAPEKKLPANREVFGGVGNCQHDMVHHHDEHSQHEDEDNPKNYKDDTDCQCDKVHERDKHDKDCDKDLWHDKDCQHDICHPSCMTSVHCSSSSPQHIGHVAGTEMDSATIGVKNEPCKVIEDAAITCKVVSTIKQTSGCATTALLSCTADSDVDIFADEMDINTQPACADNGLSVQMGGTFHAEDLLNVDMEEFLEDWRLMEMVPEGKNLELTSWTRCTVVGVMVQGRNKLLQLRLDGATANGDCLLQGVWSDTMVTVGDIVSVIAHRHPEQPAWVIDDDDGFMIVHPDTLISGTSVVGSLFCQRRSILSEWFRGIDGSSTVMVVGSLIHKLLQQVLTHRMYTVPAMQSLIQNLLSTKETVHMMYSCGMSEAQAREELLSAVPRIKQFCDTYITVNVGSRAISPDNWQGHIHSVLATEDNYWVAQLGLKGKVDVMVQAQEISTQDSKVMPLEVKTGRATNSVEHRGQVILYTLMAGEIFTDVDTGLLLYLRENQVRKVHVGHTEKRDIICRRNDMATFVTLSLSRITVEANSIITPAPLPPPINNLRACNKCPYLTLCSSFTRQEREELAFHTRQELAAAAVAHLTPAHTDYLLRWTALVQLEEAERCSKSSLKDLWCITPQQREDHGKCLAALVLEAPAMFVGAECYLHGFRRAAGTKDMRSSGLHGGQMVVLSTDMRVALATAFVLDVSEHTLTLECTWDVSERYLQELFHIDAYESQSWMSSTLTALGALFDDNNRKAGLRRIVIDRELPTFGRAQTSVLKEGHEFLSVLNPSQLQAVIQALSAHDYLLIKGMPGTGKTEMITAMIQLLVKQGLTALLVSHTHSAVDNVLLRLAKRGVDFLRLGAEGRVHEKIRPWGETAQTLHCTSPEMLDAVYKSKSVVATTCLGTNHMLFLQRTFDICIVDESTQVLQPSVLMPLFYANKFILVGDPEQLPPIVKSRRASQLGLSESLFVRLDRPEARVCLDYQYRMNRAIMGLANALTYGGQLKCANDAVAEATLQLQSTSEIAGLKPWLKRSLSANMDDAVLFLDTSLLTDNESVNCANTAEAALVCKLTEEFIKQCGVEEEHIGVIAPYRAQVNLIRKSVPSRVEVNTVDQYQGRDKEVIVFSCTKSCHAPVSDVTRQQQHDMDILSDKRRLTVAVTRAKHKLVIIGNAVTLKVYAPFCQLISSLPSHSVVPIVNSS